VAYVEWYHKGKLPRDVVGGKGASLSELSAAGFPVPSGFCVTADAYRHFLESAGLAERLHDVIVRADLGTYEGVQAASEHIRVVFSSAPIPDDVAAEIDAAYDGLVAMTGVACAVRSSAISEDGASASFAGLYESYLNVRGITGVLDSVRSCYASLWSDRAMRYRARGGGGGADEAMAVVVMGLVLSDVSGIAFTAHPVTGARDLVVINSSWGLGEAVVSGRVTPDCFIVDKNSFAVLERDIFTKELAIYSHPDHAGTIERRLGNDKRGAPSLSDEQATAVARLAARVESHYGTPQDVEWGLASRQLYLLQSRPITTLG